MELGVKSNVFYSTFLNLELTLKIFFYKRNGMEGINPGIKDSNCMHFFFDRYGFLIVREADQRQTCI